MLRVALTGGIGSGKTTVAELFAARGASVIDADALSHQLTARGGAALEEIIATFGPQVLTPDGQLDRGALRGLVFADARARKRLEVILHPRIRRAMTDRLAELQSPYAILVIPLLLETGQEDLADRILVVDLPEPLQIARVQARSGLELEEIRRIMGAQTERSVRRARADDLIDNSGDREALVPQVAALDRLYRDLSACASRRAD